MNKKDILRMAREYQPGNEDMFIQFVYTNMTDELCAFARLIAEDCAKRCEAVADGEELPAATAAADRCCEVIREAYKP